MTVSMFPRTLDRRAKIIARLGHLLGLLPLPQCTCISGESIYWRSMSDYISVGGDMHRFSWLLLDLHPVDLLCHIPNKLRAAQPTVKTQTTLWCCMLHNTFIDFFCFSWIPATDLWSKSGVGTVGHAQNTKPVQVRLRCVTWKGKSISNPIIWVC